MVKIQTYYLTNSVPHCVLTENCVKCCHPLAFSSIGNVALTYIYVKLSNKGEDYEENQYFYHPDHLGSGAFIIDAIGYAEQLPIAIGVQYLPFGESFIDQRNSYSSRYTFSAKEKDDETQYSYFGARYYDSDLSVWLSVDPLSDKYPHLSPYMYVAGNPIVMIDPNGEDVVIGLAWPTEEGESGHMVMYVDVYKEVTVTENGKSVSKKMYEKTGTAVIQNLDHGKKSATTVLPVSDDDYLKNNVVTVDVHTADGSEGVNGKTYYSPDEVQSEVDLYNDAVGRMNSKSENARYSHGKSYENQNDCSSLMIDLLADHGFISDREKGTTKVNVNGEKYQFYTPNAIILDFINDKEHSYKGKVISIGEMQKVTYGNAKAYLKNEIPSWVD